MRVGGLCLAVVIAASAVTAGVRPLGAEGVPDDGPQRLWGDVIIPGGATALVRGSGVLAAVEEWRAIPLIIELQFGGLPDTASAGLQVYADAIRRLAAQTDPLLPDRILSLDRLTRDPRRGDVDDLLETLGLRFDRRREAVQARTDGVSYQRVEALGRAGFPMTNIVAELNGGKPVSLASSDSVAPLPLGPAWWGRQFKPAPPPNELLWTILANRSTALLYYALMGMDDSTLAAVQTDDRLAAVLRRHSATLPANGGSIRMTKDRIVPAGGEELGPLWEDLIGKPLNRPAEFVDELLGTDDGRLAYFYSTVGALGMNEARFVAGDQALKPGTRRQRFRELYSVFHSALKEWRPETHPFSRPAGGPAAVLFGLRARADGGLAGPRWGDFWNRALEVDDWPEDLRRAAGRVDQRRMLDGPALLTLMCPDGACSSERLDVFTFAQRQFPDAVPEEAPALLGAVRARMRFPTLALEIERMRLDNAGLYASMGNLASKIEQLDQPAQAVALLQLQGALAMLGYMRTAGTSAETITSHLTTLASLPLRDSGFHGGLVRWLTADVVRPAAGETVDEAAILVMTRSGTQPDSTAWEWEGVRYRVDRPGSEGRRIGTMRQVLAANTLSAAAAVVRVADASAAAATAGEPAAIPAFLTELETVLAGSRAVNAVAWAGESHSFGSADLAKEAASAFRRVRRGDRARIARATAPMLEAADVLAADALSALAYALLLQDPRNPLTLSPELARRHNLYGLLGSPAARLSPWTVPAERSPGGGTWHVDGSLLGLDVGIPRLAARRLGRERPESVPTMSLVTAETLRRGSAMMTVWTASEGEREQLLKAWTQGEQAVEGWRKAGRVDGAAATAGLAGPKLGLIRWSLARGTLPPRGLLRLDELARLGGWRADFGSTWGAAPQRATSCFCLQFPRTGWEASGQPLDESAAAATLVEPVLRVVRELAERRLPSVLAPGVLGLLMTDLIEQAAVAGPFDIQSIVASLNRIPAARFDDFIAAVLARGPVAALADDKEDR